MFAAAALLLCTAGCRDEGVGRWVDPNIGGVAPLLTTVMPQVHRPHAMVRIYPVTEPGLNDRYFSDRIYGIALNMPRYRNGAVTAIMPTAGDVSFDPERSSSWYDHDLEELHPWSHRVWLEDFGGVDDDRTRGPLRVRLHGRRPPCERAFPACGAGRGERGRESGRDGLGGGRLRPPVLLCRG